MLCERELSPHLSEEQLDRLADIGAVVAPDVAAHYVDLWNDGSARAPTTSAFGGPVLIVRGGADAFVTEQMIDAISPRFVAASTSRSSTTGATGCMSNTRTRSRR